MEDSNKERSKWLTSQEAADYVRMSLSNFMNLVSNGYVPRCKLGKRNRYLKEDLDQMILNGRVEAWNGNQIR